MNKNDIVYGNNNRRWKLVLDNGDGMWLAHVWTPEAAHIAGISPPLHLVNEKHMSLTERDDLLE